MAGVRRVIAGVWDGRGETGTEMRKMMFVAPWDTYVNTPCISSSGYRNEIDNGQWAPVRSGKEKGGSQTCVMGSQSYTQKRRGGGPWRGEGVGEEEQTVITKHAPLVGRDVTEKKGLQLLDGPTGSAGRRRGDCSPQRVGGY